MMGVFMEIQHVPVAKTEMLIRKPVSEVFEAFVNPAITSRFWFTKGSGRLEAGKQIRWDWEMYNHSVEVSVKAIEENKRILIVWGAYGEATTVEWVLRLERMTPLWSVSRTEALMEMAMRWSSKRSIQPKDLRWCSPEQRLFSSTIST
jgi:uncharacterized protein YndB with AHSA1/START domain